MKPAVRILFLLILFPFPAGSQEPFIRKFLSDSSLTNALVSLTIIDSHTGGIVASWNSKKVLTGASVTKLLTTAAALELLGPDYRFKTSVGYTGEFSGKNGVLNGDLVISGGGDPSLGSERFPQYYKDIFEIWTIAVKDYGIRKIRGRVLTDDTRYDYEPVPGGWVWEDIGNYYGAGVYGLSLYDNTLKIIFRTSGEGTVPVIIGTDPPETGINYVNFLTASGNSDQGYVFTAPYSSRGWISGSIPVNRNNFELKASIPDPPLLAANLLTEKLIKGGVKISGKPSTFRLDKISGKIFLIPESEIESPPLREIIKVLNSESVNLYAEHLLKEMGLVVMGKGTAEAGIEAIKEFLGRAGIDCAGLSLTDGSGLSPGNLLNSEILAKLLLYMKEHSRNYDIFFSSLPAAGKEGTLKNAFRDTLFDGRLRAKSGSMTRVKSFAGYLTTSSGMEMIFSIIINGYTGTQAAVTARIEETLKHIIMNY